MQFPPQCSGVQWSPRQLYNKQCSPVCFSLMKLQLCERAIYTCEQLCYSKVSLSCTTVFSNVWLQCSSLIQSKLHASFQRPLRGLCRGLMEATELMERPEGGLHQAPVHYFKRHEVEEAATGWTNANACLLWPSCTAQPSSIQNPKSGLTNAINIYCNNWNVLGNYIL